MPDVDAGVADRGDRLDVVEVTVGREDAAHAGGPAHLEQQLVLVGGVDDHRFAAALAAHDEHVVLVRPDDELLDAHRGRLVVGRTRHGSRVPGTRRELTGARPVLGHSGGCERRTDVDERTGRARAPRRHLVRGRGLRRPVPDGPTPTFGLYLLGKQPPPTSWPARWVAWPDFRTPRQPDDAAAALVDVHRRAAVERVEIACGGGRGRTGTAWRAWRSSPASRRPTLSPTSASATTDRAVETPGQRRFVHGFPQLLRRS